MANAGHIDWVDAAKGLSILMVVLLYSVYSVGEDTGQTTGLHYAVGFMTPFRMPDFFAISGLFLSRTLQKGTLTILDRRVFHYVYFYLIWMVIHIAVKVGLTSADPGLALSQMGWALIQPYGVLWFIYVLALVNLAVLVLNALRVPHWLALVGAAALQIASVQTGIYAIDQFAAYFVYFYAGYALAPLFFNLVGLAQAYKVIATGVLIVWAVYNGVAVYLPEHMAHATHFDMGLASLPVVHLGYAFSGIMAIFATAGLLVSLPFMSWLTWIGKRSIIIYVAFAIPMSATRLVLLKIGLVTDPTLITLIAFAAALTVPFVLHGLVQITGMGHFLFARPSWLHLERLRLPHRGKLNPAE